MLQPAGFTRNGRNWIRIRDGFEDCVNLQVSSRAGTTANISYKDLATDAIWNEAVPPDAPGLYYHATVRIGQLMDRTDHWWRRDPNGPRELSQAIVTYGLPFLDSCRPLANQAASFGRGETKWFNARLRIGLAITLYRMGEHDEACAALANPPKHLLPSWLEQVEAVRLRLGCGG
ncbi:DUF4304 domain-containing protein [Phenylobacterium sp. LH3H17]|uniref:DUF4304 domain-containing protein n=1 Tax=Phenylobacterium sp. LH3H17 TaxID=2903901 RepID=UPI0020CA0E5A|nr:DUF4304 domain-containing protein [Phenylobacterium sp. LH3H17]UTP40250.1 DUF4304 domain-containing protein [Phenylobacterium sp. LH3H17]